MINNAILVAKCSWVCGDAGTILTATRNYRAVASAVAAATDGKWLVTLTEPVAQADIIPIVSLSNITNAAAGAGVFANITRLTDTTFEVAVFSATAVVLNNEAVQVHVAILKLAPA